MYQSYLLHINCNTVVVAIEIILFLCGFIDSHYMQLVMSVRYHKIKFITLKKQVVPVPGI